MKQISMLALAFALVAGMTSVAFAGEGCGACPSKEKEAKCCAKDCAKECCSKAEATTEAAKE